MGRTLLPFSQLIEQERRTWAPFRRALRKEDQATFDRLFDCAKLHVQAGAYLSRPWPFEVIAMAILLEQQKRLERVLTWIETFDKGAQSLIYRPPENRRVSSFLLDGLTPLPPSPEPREAQP